MDEKLELNLKDGKGLTDYVEKQALERIRYGSLMAEADFYAGAASVIQFLFGGDPKDLTKIVPPMWILGIFSGRSPSTRWEEDETLRAQHDSKLERQSRLYQNAELMYEYVCDMWDSEMYGEVGGIQYHTPRQILNLMRTHARLILEDIGLYDFWSEEEE